MWIDARSNVHPIHSTPTAWRAIVELELGPTGPSTWPTTPSGKLSLPVSRLSSGNRMEDRELQKRIDARRYPTIEGVLGEMAADRRRRQLPGDAATSPSAASSRRHEDQMTVRAVDDRTDPAGRGSHASTSASSAWSRRGS